MPRAPARTARPASAALKLGAAAVAMTLTVAPALATWSIVIVNTRTGEVAAASATCLTGFDLQANTPVMLTGIGAATAQSSVDSDSTNRTFIRDRLNLGVPLQDILAGLLTFDTSPQSRQYGMVDITGRAATFTGIQAGKWAGGRTGVAGDLVYAVQGNVLTGAPVVDFAVAAIESTPGDIPTKLMAAMEAARQYGGDGRCSCTTGTPDSCGSPPPVFTKSAHIAYMLIARAGDRDGTNPMYKNLTATSVAIADFNGDGKPDIATAGGNPSVAILNNITPPGHGATFAPGYKSLNGIVNRDLAAADVNADGKPDIVGISNSADRIAVFLNLGDGVFDPPVLYPTGDGPTALSARDFNGDDKVDIVTADTGTLTFAAGVGNGTLAAPVSVPIDGGMSAFLRAGDFDGDGDQDVALGTAAPNAVVVFLNAAGAFARTTTIPTEGTLTALEAADMDNDGKADLLFGVGTDTSLRYARSTGAGFDLTSVSAGATVGGVVARDVTGDGLLDLVTTLRTTARIAVIPQQPGGVFGAPAAYPVGFNRNRIAIEDFDADGDLDLALPAGNLLVAEALSNGVFPSPGGLGGGDFFMTFNVPNQTSTAPDPVFTLRSMFDAWRSNLVGKPDAISSLATLDRAYVRADGVSAASLTVRGRDHTGADVPLVPSSLEITNTSDAPLTSAGPVSQNLDGSLSVTITAGTACGADRYSLRLTGNFRPVTLMPETIVEVSPATDITADGYVTGDDFDLFANLFVAGDLVADFNHDGFVTADDFDAFVAKFVAGGC